MTAETAADGLRARISRQSEDALGRLAQELLESPFVSSAISRAFEAREKAAQAQEVAMGALNLPSAADLERLTRRVRSVSQRLEGIEDGVDRLDRSLTSVSGAVGLEERLEARLEAKLDAKLEAKLAEHEKRLVLSLAGEIARSADIMMEHMTALFRVADDRTTAVSDRLDAHVADTTVHKRPRRRQA